LAVTKKMNEKEYFKISERKKISARCPILDYCVRRAYTLYFLGGYKNGNNKSIVKILQENNILRENFNDFEIPLSGEIPEFMNGNDYVVYENFCPEVNLFDNIGFKHSRETASTSGEWDKFRKVQFKNKKYRHYSECSEYCSYKESTKNSIKKTTRKRRTPISRQLRFEIFQRDNFTCQYCGKQKVEKAELEIDHIIPIAEGGKDEYSNLTTSCKDCNRGKSNKMI
jgi:HNH endonuclease